MLGHSSGGPASAYTASEKTNNFACTLLLHLVQKIHPGIFLVRREGNDLKQISNLKV